MINRIIIDSWLGNSYISLKMGCGIETDFWSLLFLMTFYLNSKFEWWITDLITPHRSNFTNKALQGCTFIELWGRWLFVPDNAVLFFTARSCKAQMLWLCHPGWSHNAVCPSVYLVVLHGFALGHTRSPDNWLSSSLTASRCSVNAKLGFSLQFESSAHVLSKIRGQLMKNILKRTVE